MSEFRNLFKELKRRSVYRIAIAYAVTAWLAAQILSLVTETFGAPEWVMKMMIVILAIGFPISLIIAWAFEVTPEGVKKTDTSNDMNNDAPAKGRSLNYWIIGVLSLALVFLGVERIFFSGLDLPGGTNMASVAILPFGNSSTDGEDDYFSEGISQELVNRLAGVEELKVPGWTSSNRFRGDTDLEEVSNSLQVAHVLEGNVRRAGDQLRISTQLINTAEREVIWSDTFDRQLTTANIFQIQEEIALEVVSQLKVRLLPEQREELSDTPTESIEAYNLYLKGNSFSASWIAADLRKAIKFYDQAIELDPSFALAYAKKAMAYYYLGEHGNLTPQEAVDLGTDAAEWALLLNSELAEGYLAMALIHRENGQWPKSTASIQKAYELKPNDPTIRTYWNDTQWRVNQFDAKTYQEQMEKVIELDPLSPLSHLYMGNAFERTNTEEYNQKAEMHFRKAIELQPDYLAAYRELTALIGDHQKNYDESVILMHQASKEVEASSPVFFELIEHALTLDLVDFAKIYMDELLVEFPKNNSVINIYSYYLEYTGQHEERVQFMKKNYLENDRYTKQYFLTLGRNSMLLAGKEEEYLKLVEQYYPNVLRTDSAAASRGQYAMLEASAWAMKRLGRVQEAEALANTYLRYIEAMPEEQYLKMEDSYVEIYVYPYAIFNSLKGENKYAKNLISFELRNRPFYLRNIIINQGFNELYLRVDLQDVAEDLQYADSLIAVQRNNVIAYLKEQGEWDESWE